MHALSGIAAWLDRLCQYDTTVIILYSTSCGQLRRLHGNRGNPPPLAAPHLVDALSKGTNPWPGYSPGPKHVRALRRPGAPPARNIALPAISAPQLEAAGGAQVSLAMLCLYFRQPALALASHVLIVHVAARSAENLHRNAP